MFPIPPTDNLYKFLAITGLLIIFAPLVLYWSLELEYLQKNFEVKPTMLALEIEGRKLELETAKILAESERAELSKDAAKQERLRIGYKDSLERFDAHRVKVAEMTAKHDLLVVLADRLRLILNVAKFAIGFGAACTLAGFGLWYTKVQVHQDRALRETKKR